MIYKLTLLLCSICLITATATSQILWTEPAFPTQDQQVTIYYDASEGNGALDGIIPVYAHTGVITNLSESPTDWQHVQGNWGTADPNVLMTPLGNNVHSFNFAGQTLEEFYGVGDGETINALSFVFRNQAGTTVGRAEDQGDIFYSLTDGSFAGAISAPTSASVAIEANEELEIVAQVSESSDLVITVDGSEVASAMGETSISYTFSSVTAGEFLIEFEADNGTDIITDQRNVVVLGEQIIATAPDGTVDGINYMSDSEVVFQLYAPGKSDIFVIGDFNDWSLSLDYKMNLDTDGETFWLAVDGLTPGQEYGCQYWILSDNMRVADPHSEKILDPWNDQWIPEENYPGLMPYPTGQTFEPVGVIQPGAPDFTWTDGNFVRPQQEKLVVYELLLRDFIEAHSYEVLQDSLDYLENLGVNAIQFMPINEFEGNESWGYNPSFFLAPDKYYGSKDALKNFINAAHQRGMAVIMDIALNHSFGQNPQVRMWFDPNNGPFGAPTTDNPYFNVSARHDFNVGYDYNHESAKTREFSKRVLEHWVTEYHVDGYRMDLSKGFTQNNTLGNIGAWNAYDQSRINILTDYKNHVQGVAPGAYMILEHFADNSEETALANDGFMLWGNVNHDYSEAVMGYGSNFAGVSYQNRGWNDPHLVGYMESHDEERLMYKAQEFGNSNGSYDVTDLNTGLARVEAASCLFLPVPGPKMIWQFGELGYDFSINYCLDGTINENCRTGNKPIRWDYLENNNRKRIYNVMAALNHLKATEPAFSTGDFNMDTGGTGKRIHLNHSSMNVTIVGNFGVTAIDMVPGFQNTGTWYDYFTGESIEVNDLNASFNYQAGEYHLYTTVPLETPVIDTSVEDLDLSSANVYPNPFKDQVTIGSAQVALDGQVRITDLTGKVVKQVNIDGQRQFRLTVPTSDIAQGTYVITWGYANGVTNSRLLIKE